MPNGKTHFITGTLIGAIVNLLIQSTKMAMDYDREFDWDEFFLCAGAGAFASLVHEMPQPDTSRYNTNASLPLPKGEGEGSDRKPIGELLEIVGLTNLCQLFHATLSAALIAYAFSGNRTPKLSRTTRLFLWSFTISYLSHITLDCATPKRIDPNRQSLSVTYSNL